MGQWEAWFGRWEVGCGCALREGGEKVLRERWEVREGVVLVIFGSSHVERAHNLSNKVPLGGVEAEELDQSVIF